MYTYLNIMYERAGADPKGGWCINGNMGRVREKKRWRKEEKWRER
jgi:hypothetical protein